MQLPSAPRISLSRSHPLPCPPLSISPVFSVSLTPRAYKRYLDTRTILTVKIPSRSRHCYSSEQIPAPEQLNSKTVALMNRAFF